MTIFDIRIADMNEFVKPIKHNRSDIINSTAAPYSFLTNLNSVTRKGSLELVTDKIYFIYLFIDFIKGLMYSR